MIEIALSSGKVALVDNIDSDLDTLKWAAHQNSYRVWYADRSIKGKHLSMHRVIFERMIGRKLNKTESVDHINCDGLDNRRSNLRLANRSQQQANSFKQRTANGKPTYSRFKGVSWYKHIHKWAARIQHNCKDEHLGVFASENDAAKAYDQAALKYFGEYARTNF